MDKFETYHNTNIAGRKIKLDFVGPLQPGDHIYIILSDPILYEHHGIYIGNNRVIHFQNFIVQTHIATFCDDHVIRKRKSTSNYEHPTNPPEYEDFAREDVVARA